MQLLKLSNRLKAAYHGSDVHSRVDRLDGWMDRAHVEDAGPTGYDHAETVKEYYDLCNELMVFGWGESLHFAPLSPRESLDDSKVRHQRLMISKLELREGMTVIDVGCGIGGPMRRVVREAGVRAVGVNINQLQLEKSRALDAEAGLEHMVDYLACSFMDMGGGGGHRRQHVRPGVRDRVDVPCAGQGGRVRRDIPRAETGSPLLGSGDVHDGQVRPRRRSAPGYET